MSDDNPKINLLMVDDRPENLLALESLLDSPELNLVKADSGNQALREVLKCPFALVLLDVQMPGMDGFETAELMRMNPKTRNIPIIFLTALSREQHYVFRGYETGAVDYLAKPIEPMVLKSKVDIFCQLFRQRLEIEQSYKKLQKLEEMRDAMVHMVVHDLRTPIWGIHGYLEMLAETETEISEEGQELIGQMTANSASLLEMVSSILDVSKMEAGSMQIHVGECRIKETVERIFKKLNPLVRDRVLRVTSELEEPGIIRADAELIPRVLENLISNALKFTPEFGGEIDVRLWKDEEHVYFSIQDNGSGVPADCQARVFDKFGQVEDRMNYRKYSTGLGLPFCKMALEAHGGTIRLDSEEGKGSTFTCSIPLNL